MQGQTAEVDIPERFSNDPETFAQLVRDHQAMVFSLAYAALRNRALAEEAAQDVFLELHRHLGALESQDHARHWLRRVATHRVIDQARRRKLEAQSRLEDAPEPSSPAPQHDPLLAALLGRLVATLPEKARMVVILRFQEDLDVAEIAAVLDLPVRAVRNHLARSLALLREKVARRCGEIPR